MTYFRTKRIALSSALERFTDLFGMGRGGSTPLWSSDIGGCGGQRAAGGQGWSWGCGPAGGGRNERFGVRDGCPATGMWVMDCGHGCGHRSASQVRGYRVKPHGQLVRVSSTDYSAYTPRLSTSWSRTTLKGSQAPGKSHLEASFPLRCFQRLSLPHIATRRCHWRDNRYTRGASTPVLSY